MTALRGRVMRGSAFTGLLLGFLAALASFILVAPGYAPGQSAGAAAPDLNNGRSMFFAGGCASCHAAPASAACDNPKTRDKFTLAGGRCLKTPFGTFYAPNISPDKETGIGGWSTAQFIRAMRQGVSPQGKHYYPAFPYPSYQRMFDKDLIDLKAFLDTLPAVKSNVPDHDLSLPFRLRQMFGTFYAPNISPDKETGIGGWSTAQFIRAMRQGVSPQGKHYYPAFPYPSYQRMFDKDLIDLKAFLDTLPAVKSNVPDHDLSLPFRLRQTLVIWKWLFLDGKKFAPDPDKGDKWNRGAYLVQGPGHCGECHSPRNPLGGIISDKRYSGAPNPEGKGIIPNITQHKNGIADWSEADIITALETGLTPSFDTFGGTMVKGGWYHQRQTLFGCAQS